VKTELLVTNYPTERVENNILTQILFDL